MATKTTTATTKKKPATTSKRVATNGTKAKTTKPRPKKLEEMTVEEIGQLAWETSYKNRHKRLDA